MFVKEIRISKRKHYPLNLYKQIISVCQDEEYATKLFKKYVTFNIIADQKNDMLYYTASFASSTFVLSVPIYTRINKQVPNQADTYFAIEPISSFMSKLFWFDRDIQVFILAAIPDINNKIEQV